jgi:FkbM family methyltransferase
MISLLRKLRKFGYERAKYKPQKSYSQCGEDLILNFIFMLLKMDEVRYLDIGAHHPTWLSNSYLLYKRGSSGVLVEPDPILCSVIRQHRPNDICLNIGVGVGEGDEADFYVMTTKTLNTFSKEEALRYQDYGREKIEEIIRIPLVSVNGIIQKYFDTCPNFVSLDVEGLDMQILQDFNFERFRPEVFCIETLTYTENNTETKLSNLIDFMKAQDYFVYADTYINTIFVDNAVWKKR